MREQSHSIILGLRTDPIGIGLADQFKYVSVSCIVLDGIFFFLFCFCSNLDRNVNVFMSLALI